MHTVTHTAANGTHTTYYARKGVASAHRIGRTCLRTQGGSYTVSTRAGVVAIGQLWPTGTITVSTPAL